MADSHDILAKWSPGAVFIPAEQNLAPPRSSHAPHGAEQSPASSCTLKDSRRVPRAFGTVGNYSLENCQLWGLQEQLWSHLRLMDLVASNRFAQAQT